MLMSAWVFYFHVSQLPVGLIISRTACARDRLRSVTSLKAVSRCVGLMPLWFPHDVESGGGSPKLLYDLITRRYFNKKKTFSK